MNDEQCAHPLHRRLHTESGARIEKITSERINMCKEVSLTQKLKTDGAIGRGMVMVWGQGGCLTLLLDNPL